ncbi:MAG: hypothetical protein QMD85_01870 [Candidatus Aenigmarchaeota archaeon]|nr:hypothetical protein [Candidatus Aenigmarchaeota archaeon]MDI6722297.1 hypothetical protein [Candidatus Aenigmarchaeota archaeon]
MRKVLLVDDRNPVLTDTTKRLLTNRGHEVFGCHTWNYDETPKRNDVERVLYIALDIESGPVMLERICDDYPTAKVVIFSTRPFLEKYEKQIRDAEAQMLQMPKRYYEIAASLE